MLKIYDKKMKLFIFIISYLINFPLFTQSIELKNEYRETNRYFKEKKYDKALKSNEKALRLSIKEFGVNHLTTATLLEHKGRLLLELNNFYVAEEEFRKVFNIRKELVNEYSPDMAECLNYLALALRKQNKLEEAMVEHGKVLNIMSNVIANNPGQISELSRRSALYRARAYQTKGQLLISQENYSEAEGNFNIAEKIFERTLSENNKELDVLKLQMRKLSEIKN